MTNKPSKIRPEKISLKSDNQRRGRRGRGGRRGGGRGRWWGKQRLIFVRRCFLLPPRSSSRDARKISRMPDRIFHPTIHSHSIDFVPGVIAFHFCREPAPFLNRIPNASRSPFHHFIPFVFLGACWCMNALIHSLIHSLTFQTVFPHYAGIFQVFYHVKKQKDRNLSVRMVNEQRTGDWENSCVILGGNIISTTLHAFIH